MKKLFSMILAALMLLGTVHWTYAQTNLSAPPATWQEHWFEHNQVVKLVYYNDDVAVYFDDDINKTNASWVFSFMTNVWKYSKQVYGSMGGDGRLYVIIHQKYPGGHPSYYYNASHDYRNVIDVGGSDFSSPSGWNIDVLTHEVGHIVESTTNGAKGSPAFRIWGDSKWCEIYGYDVYNGIGMTSDAKRIYDSCINGTDSFPKPGTAWFKNWFYPLWNNYGKSQALSKYFQLLSQYYPKNSDGSFTRSMNMGEFVHFMSGAAGADLKPLATNAFGWTSEYETEYQKARQDFPLIIYGTNPSTDKNVALNKSATANQSVTGEGPEKAVDGSIASYSNGNSKWCSTASGDKWLKVDLGQNYNINRWVVKHAGSGGENTAWNTKDFKLQKSSDGTSWTDVDAVAGNTASITDRTVAAFASRYVRLYITAPSSTSDQAARIYEFEVYGSSVPTGSDYVAWAPNISYKVGDMVTYGGKNYMCVQAHTSLTGWEPANVPALWQVL